MSNINKAENIGFQESDDFEEFTTTDNSTSTAISVGDGWEVNWEDDNVENDFYSELQIERQIKGQTLDKLVCAKSTTN